MAGKRRQEILQVNDSDRPISLNSHKSLIKSLARCLHWLSAALAHIKRNNCESRDSEKMDKNKFTFRFFIAWVAVKCVWHEKKKILSEKLDATTKKKNIFSFFWVLVTKNLFNNLKKTFFVSVPAKLFLKYFSAHGLSSSE